MQWNAREHKKTLYSRVLVSILATKDHSCSAVCFLVQDSGRMRKEMQKRQSSFTKRSLSHYQGKFWPYWTRRFRYSYGEKTNFVDCVFYMADRRIIHYGTDSLSTRPATDSITSSTGYYDASSRYAARGVVAPSTGYFITSSRCAARRNVAPPTSASVPPSSRGDITSPPRHNVASPTDNSVPPPSDDHDASSPFHYLPSSPDGHDASSPFHYLPPSAPVSVASPTDDDDSFCPVVPIAPTAGTSVSPSTNGCNELLEPAHSSPGTPFMVCGKGNVWAYCCIRNSSALNLLRHTTPWRKWKRRKEEQ